MIFKEEKRLVMSSTDDEVEEILNTETFSMEKSNMTTTKVKIEEVREENERLKVSLSQIMKDYHSLKMQLNGITQEDQSKKATNLASMAASDDESELVSLSLGRFSSDSTKQNNDSYKESKNLEKYGKRDGIELGLMNFKPHSDKSVQVSRTNLRSENSLDEESKEEVRSSPKNSRTGDDEILQHNPLKKPRVSVRAVCNTQTMHDGCQWRKYGQKIAKGNPCPRAYYRCTVSTSCPVRKQVQRCMDDTSILITTYEGTHNHPLAPSATTMASATSAAVAMLSCGSSASPRVSAAANPSLFGYSNNNNNNNYPRATISSSQSHPTVILDLTAPNQKNKLFSSTSLFSAATHSSPTSFNFSSNFPAMNNAIMPPYSQPAPPLFNDEKITAATKAITHDPNFQSALAAAIMTSFVGNSNNSSSIINVGGRNSGMDFHLNFSQPASTNNASIGCAAASFINRFPQ